MAKTSTHVPRRVFERIRKGWARNERMVVVPGKRGRVFEYEKYQKVKAVAKKVKPHTFREKSPKKGGIPGWHVWEGGRDLGSLSRSEICDGPDM